MQISTRPISFLDIAKIAIYGIFLNYYCFNILRGNLLPHGTIFFYAIAGACVIVSAFGEKICLSVEVKCWIVYAVFSVVTAGFALSSSAVLNGLGDYFQRLVLIIMIAFICEKEQSAGYAIRLLAVTAIACAISSLLMSENVSVKLTMISGARISTNDIGALMAFGCFAVLFAFGVREKKGVIKNLLKIFCIFAAVSVIFIAGSRKSLLAIMIFFALIFLLCARDLFKSLSGPGVIITTLLIVGVMIFIYSYLLPIVESTDMYQSVFGHKADSKAMSDEGRIELYSKAWKHFLEHPLIGIGYDNFAFKHGAYTHSTYAEPLACSGIGGLLYLVPYVIILVKQMKLIYLFRFDQQERLWQKELFAFYISFLFVGVGIPYMYKDVPCIILAMFIASQQIAFNKLKEPSVVINEEGDNSETIPNQSITSYS